jgi:hypothetical protein
MSRALSIIAEVARGRPDGRGERRVSTEMLHAAVFAAALAFKGVVVVRHRNHVEEPVYGALVTVDDAASAITLPDGSFEIDGLAPGTHAVVARSNAGVTFGNVDIDSGPRTLVVLDPTCWAIYGKVTDADTKKPIAGASVHFLGESTTDVNGDYFINWGCSSAPGFRFHNSFDYWIDAPHYQEFSAFGGRAEYIAGVMIRDFALTHSPPNPREPFRPSPIR